MRRKKTEIIKVDVKRNHRNRRRLVLTPAPRFNLRIVGVLAVLVIALSSAVVFVLIGGKGEVVLPPPPSRQILQVFGNPNDPAWTIDVIGDDNFRILADDTVRMLIGGSGAYAGNVGIGDNTPAALLTVGSGDLFQVNSSGAIAAAAGITSSGTINFSGLTASKVVFTDASKNLTSTGTVGVNQGGTGITSGNSGGILGFTAPGTIASSAALAQNQLVIGGGAGATPTTLGSLGTTTTVLHGNASGAPSFGSVSLTADVSGVLPAANGGTGIAYFTVSGPTAARTFAFPDANATVLTTNAAVTVAQGGTGQTSANSAFNALAPSQTGNSGKFLTTDGTDTSWATAGGGGSSISAGDSNVTVTDTGDGYITFTEDGGEIMRITNSKVGIGVTGPTAVLHLKAGTATASTAPLKFTTGALLTAPEAGAIEYLTNIFYQTGTDANRRVDAGIYFTSNVGDFTGSNGTAAQPIFQAANDTFTAEANTTYLFDLFLSVTNGTTTCTKALVFAGTATYAKIRYDAIGQNVASTAHVDQREQ